MSIKISLIFAAFLACSVPAVSEASFNKFMSQEGVMAMEKVFARSEKTHSMAMAAIMKSMSPKKAWQVLERSNLTTPALLEMSSNLQGKQSYLRKADPAKKGYGGVEGARKLLNDMIYESQSKYDAETLKCTEYYAQQCGAMEMARGEIAGANYVAANSRALILDSQDAINKCEVDIPTRQLQLQNHNSQCKSDIAKMRAEVAVVEADIQVVTSILNMTDCAKKSLMQMRMLRCQDPCTKKSFVTFEHANLKQVVSQLQSPVAHSLMQESLADLYKGIESLEAVEFSQLDAHQSPVINKTTFYNPPVPRTDIPANPCQDANAGAPSSVHKRAAKCSISKSPQCYKLQERFLLIQSGIEDTKSGLLEDIASMEDHCKETAATLQSQIQNDQDLLSEEQTKLSQATEKEANAGEKARQTAMVNSQLDKDLKKQMKACSSNYINFETEACALKKIRGELYAMQGSGHSARVFVDCEVSPKWDPEECSKECKRKQEADGIQKLIRSVMTHPDGGSKCLPLSAVRKCNLQPCPVDCKLSAWSGWSKCSAECGGGVRQRLREVKKAMRYGGTPCGQASETEACNNQACEKDCELSEWSKWSWCSKDCDGGTRKRQKHITASPKGIGKCPASVSPDRLEHKNCNQFACLSPKAGDCSDYTSDTKLYSCATLPTCCSGHQGLGLTDATVQCLPSTWATGASGSQYKVKCGVKPKQCNKELDVVLLIDGSGSLGEKGWKAEIKAAQTFVDAFSGTGAKANMAVVLFSGPRTWPVMHKCTGRNPGKVDMEKDCMLRTVTHLTNDMPAVKKSIAGLTWPQGGTLTSFALLKAKYELTLGRKNAKSVIVVITDGKPMSNTKTLEASRDVRKMARLVWVPVTTYAPLMEVKKWATSRWQENVVVVKSFADLEKPDPVNHVIADICPKH